MSWPIPPKTPELTHFDQKNDVEEEAHQHEMAVKKPESNKKIPKFILSRGFPLRYLARMEASHEKLVMLVFKHECPNEVEADGQLIV